MADLFMDVDTAVVVPVNLLTLVDDSDFKTEENPAYNAAGMDLLWNFCTTAGVTTKTAVTPTDASGTYEWACADGMATIEIPASGGASINNDAEGFGWFSGRATGVYPFRGPVIGFRASALNNALIDGGGEWAGINMDASGNVRVDDSTPFRSDLILIAGESAVPLLPVVDASGNVYVNDSTPVAANLKQINGLATDGNNATLKLKQLSIVNTADSAVIAATTAAKAAVALEQRHATTSYPALDLTVTQPGNISAHALRIGAGGGTNAGGVNIHGGLNGYGVKIQGGGAAGDALVLAAVAAANNDLTLTNARHNLFSILVSSMAALAETTFGRFIYDNFGLITTKIGSPAGASVSADIADVEGKVDDLESRLGVPVGASVVADIAAVQTDVDDIEGDAFGTDSCTLTIRTDAGVPIVDAQVFISSDLAGTQRSRTKFTNSLGAVRFGLTAGVTYYCWRFSDSTTFASNPVSFVAVEDA